MKRFCLIVASLACALAIACAGGARAKGKLKDPSAALWPQFRHDAGLTAASPLKGALAKPPKEIWTADLGGSTQQAEQIRLEDLNGDGHIELLRILPDRLVCLDLRGKTLWEVTGLTNPTVVDARDWAGGGVMGLRVANNTGVATQHFMVNGATGGKAFLFTQQDTFGGHERAGHILAGVKGQQLCVWWDGENPKDHSTTKYGDGYLWSFENGPDKPTQRFHAQCHGVVYSGQHLFADMDGDGKDEFVMIGHQQMWLFDTATGQLKAYMPWQPEIRSYMALMAAVPLKKGELPSLLEINYMIPGAQVIKQDGKKATRLWKSVVAPEENQYQITVKVGPGALDPFIDLDGDGVPEMLMTATNEHGDGKLNLVIYDARTGKRLYEKPCATLEKDAGTPTGRGPMANILTADDLDGDGRPELLFKDGDTLRIATFDGKDFVTRWTGQGAEPLLTPPPPEGRLDRCTIVGFNAPLWRESKGSRAFLLRFPDGVYGCELPKKGALKKLRKIERHEALGNAAEAKPPLDTYGWKGQALVALENGKEVWSYEMPTRRAYTPPAPIVGRLDGQAREARVIARAFDGTLISLDGKGGDRRELLKNAPASIGVDCNSLTGIEPPLIADLDGDGQNELISTATVDGKPCVVIMDGKGQVKRTIEPIPTATQVLLGVTGRMGTPDGRRWLVVRYTRKFERECVVAYDGKTGQELWRRDSYTSSATPYKFVLWLPTAVYDYDGDGADDLICYSANDYGIISVKDNRDLFPLVTITGAFPGHWPAYPTPILANFTGSRKPELFLSRAYSMIGGMTLDGKPIWHYGFRRSEGGAHHGIAADLDGDGKDEVIMAQPDGLLRAFSGIPQIEKCPICPPDASPSEKNRAGKPLWTLRLKPPVSDMAAADLDADGKMEALCGAGDGKLYAIKQMGGEVRTLWSVELSKQAVGGPILADLNGNGNAEILAASDDGVLHCLGRAK